MDRVVAEIADLASASAALQDAGLKRAYPDAPESVADTPAMVIVPDQGKRKWPATNGLRSVDHEIHVQVLLGRSDLASADQAAKPFIGAVFDLFDQNVTLGALVTASGVTAYKYGKTTYGGVDFVAVDFTVSVMERTPIAYHA